MPLFQVTQFQIDSAKLVIIYYDGNHTTMISWVKFQSHKIKFIRIKNDTSIEELNTNIRQKVGEHSQILFQIYYAWECWVYNQDD